MGPSDDATRADIDRALQDWRQGDCVVGTHYFLFRLDVEAPLTGDAADAAREGVDAAESEVPGFMVATQTCDLVRSCEQRSFVEVCPLVAVDSDRMEEIHRGRRPAYAHVPGVADQGLVADLDRVMTVEKAVVARWERTPGCPNDGDRRRMALALARKRRRCASPDDFVDLASGLTRRLSSRHDRSSPEGRALRALREIRVRAAPSWDADPVQVTFWFVGEEGSLEFEGEEWHLHLERWLALVPAGARFREIDGAVVGLDDLTARDYVESDPLDLDHLSN